ncbi:MAG: EcsC family protein [Terriglobia bacterium]
MLECIEANMSPDPSYAKPQGGWLRRRAQQAMRTGLWSAYRRVQVDPAQYLLQLRRAHGLPIMSFRDMFSIPTPVIDYLAERAVAASMKMALAEGAGTGLGGALTIVPDAGLLAAITVRMIQKLSLIHGFEYASEDEVADLWIAMATAAGVDLGKDFLRKEVIERFVPRLIEQIAVRAGSDLVERGLARLVPVLSSVVGGTLNYYFVREWGRRAHRHFREKHLLFRSQGRLLAAPALPLLGSGPS